MRKDIPHTHRIACKRRLIAAIQITKVTHAVCVHRSVNIYCPIIHHTFLCSLIKMRLSGGRNLHVWFTAHLTVLKTLDTFGNCQRLVFSRGVSQNMH